MGGINLLIAFNKVDTTEEAEFDPDYVIFATMRRLTVRIEAYAQQMRMQCI